MQNEEWVNQGFKILDFIRQNLFKDDLCVIEMNTFSFDTYTGDAEASAIVSDQNGNEYRVIVRKEN